MVASWRLAFGTQNCRICSATIGFRDALGDYAPGVALDATEEAAPIALMACGARLLDLHEDAVGVAVDVDLLHVLDVPRALAFDPEGVPGRAPIGRPPGLERVPPGLRVHVGDHQDLAAGGVLRDRGDEAAALGEVGLGHDAVR